MSRPGGVRDLEAPMHINRFMHKTLWSMTMSGCSAPCWRLSSPGMWIWFDLALVRLSYDSSTSASAPPSAIDADDVVRRVGLVCASRWTFESCMASIVDCETARRSPGWGEEAHLNSLLLMFYNAMCEYISSFAYWPYCCIKQMQKLPKGCEKISTLKETKNKTTIFN